MATPFDDQRRAYDDAYNAAEAQARGRKARYFEAPVGSPDYLDIFKRMNPVRPASETPWQADLATPTDPVIEGQKIALRQQTDPTAPPPAPAAPATTPAAAPRADMGVATDGIPNALRNPATDTAPSIDANQAAAALSRGLQRRAYLNQRSPAAGLEGEELRKAAGYRDMTDEVANFRGPRETRYIQGQAYTPALGGGGVSTFETPDSVREQLVRDADETRLVRAIEDPDNLGTVQRRTDIERSSLEQLESHRSRLAQELESHRAGLIDGRSTRTVEHAMETLDRIEQQEMNLLRNDPRYPKLTREEAVHAEMALRTDQMRKRAELRLAALGGPAGLSQYLGQANQFPQ